MSRRRMKLTPVMRALYVTGALSAAHVAAAQTLPESRPQAIAQALYAANADVAQIELELAKDGLPADGQTPARLTLRLRGADGQPLPGRHRVTIETTGGRLLLPGAATDEAGPGALDADGRTPAVQIDVEGGEAHFALLAPMTPQTVRVRVGAGRAQTEGEVRFAPVLRPMLAVGLVEGVIRLSPAQSAAVQSVGLDDGFEQAMRHFQRASSDGSKFAAARAAFYLKGAISGETLLTAAYDSDKDTRARLLRDIQPEAFYPVYGDSALKTFDARSAGRLYVRLDNGSNYALLGDFTTGDGFVQQTGSGRVAPQALRSLGAYSRTLTGLSGQWDVDGLRVGGFAAHDSLKQVTEELRGFGLSGPFALANNSALENSEKVEILVRSQSNPGVILSVTPLRRFEDYDFEPFSGRIMLARPLASVDPYGNPQSLRITYEVDQGGPAFWVAGASADWRGEAVRLGANAVTDRNPLAPYTLASAYANWAPSERSQLTAEVAASRSRLYTQGGSIYTVPQYGGSEQVLERSALAARVAASRHGEDWNADFYAVQTGVGFYNPNAPMQLGRREASAKGDLRLAPEWKLFAEALHSEDAATGGARSGGALGAAWQPDARWTISGGLRRVQENAQWQGAANLIAPTVTPGSLGRPTGGFFGGIDPLVIDPATGQSSSSYAGLTPTAPGQGIALNTTTAFAAAQYQVAKDWQLEGLAETSVAGERAWRGAAGVRWQWAERSSLYARVESQQGLDASTGAMRSQQLAIGADTGYMPGGQWVSEYRLRDATGRESQWANGLRNTWQLDEGFYATTSAEYLRVIGSLGGSAAALAGGLDYTASPVWKAGGKLEVRRQFDNPATPGSERVDSLLSSLTVARKLSRDWTFLGRNYLLTQRWAAGSVMNPLDPTQTQTAAYTALQDRVQLGVAYRPVDSTRLDMLSRYEFMTSRNADGQYGLKEQAHIVSLHTVYHPSRPWWISGRVAAKARSEEGLSADGPTHYHAALLAGRLIWDVSERWDVGLLASVLQGQTGTGGTVATGTGRSRQSALGIETGYLVQENLWLSVGYNHRGFFDPDLTGSDYTQRGVFLRLRFKFDEDLLRGNQPAVNPALPRTTS